MGHAEKEQVIHDHFAYVLDTPAPRAVDFNWNAIDPVIEDLDDLGLLFSEEEILTAINNMPPDKAPGLDSGWVHGYFLPLLLVYHQARPNEHHQRFLGADD